MIVSHKHKFVFLHNPKVAGSAIRKALEPFHDDDHTYWHQQWFEHLDRVCDAAHLTYHDLSRVDSRIIHNGYTFLAVVRNPYKRFISSVAEFLRQHPEENFNNFVLDEWVMRNMDETNFRFNWKYIHFCPQHYFVPPTTEAGRTMEQSFVARHEKLDATWKTFLTHAFSKDGHGPEVELPKVRVRPDQDIGVRSLSPYVISQVNRVYRKDFERFGYEMLGPEQEPGSHFERVNGIHSPHLTAPEYERCTVGEQIAYRQQYL